MICRICGKQIEFVTVPSDFYRITDRVKAIHKGKKTRRGLNDNLISPSYRRTLRRELERDCREK
jgi:hypothetical protein